MNLIEQLGGYEKCKEILADAKSSNNIDPVIIIDGDEFLIDCICDALLEHRRQHGIYENEDKVVHIYGTENSMLFTVNNITDKGYNFGNDWGWRSVISNMGVGNTFRHATDSEIAAGHRID